MPQGGLRVPAALTRTGIFDYVQPDGSTIREMRPPEEVFHADALASLAHAPVTDEHPPVPVTSENFRRYSAGHVASEPRQDGELVAATLVIQDAALVRAIESRQRTQVSCGYTCDVMDQPGPGYDRIQRNIRYNHVAIVSVGRAGASVALRLDSAGNAVQCTHMLRIDGIDYPLGTEAEIKAAVAAHARASAKTDVLTADLSKVTGERDAARAELAQASDPARIEAMVSARAKLRSDAAKVLGSEDLSGRSDADVRKAVCAKAYPGISLEGRADAYLDALCEAAFAGAPKSHTTPDVINVETPIVPESRDDSAASAYKRMLDLNAKAWTLPLAATK